MQNMQSYYNDLIQTVSSSGQRENVSSFSSSQKPVNHSQYPFYTQCLVGLTKTNMAQLKSLDSLLGWTMWGADK